MRLFAERTEILHRFVVASAEISLAWRESKAKTGLLRVKYIKAKRLRRRYVGHNILRRFDVGGVSDCPVPALL